MDNVEDLLSRLTLEEKVALVAGYKFMRTNPIPRLNIPSIKCSDGPHGLRAQPDGGDNGITNSLPATCFPTASCSANTWNPSLLYKMGQAMAKEAKYYDVSVILGPGVNIKRNPRCGRNFEYFSEDPFIAGKMGEAEVNGIQNEGIGTSLKHFAFNNSENYRFMGDSVVDMRAAREIYLRHFEHIIKNAKPETVMASYTKVNGTYCSENKWLTNDILRKEWGYQGLVMSDWGATHDRVKGIQAGMDLEMPGDALISRKWLFDAVKNGSLSEKDLDEAVRNVLNLVYKHSDEIKDKNVDWETHHKLAKEIALEGAVLLKNDKALPLKEEKEYLVVGELFSRARYQGAGSSMINPYHLSSLKDAFDAHNVKYKYIKGYKENTSHIDESLIKEALEASKNYEEVVICIGLTDRFECEGVDRDNISLPENHLALVDALIKEKKKVNVILFGGSVVELPFFDHVSSILNMFLSGQNMGEACYELLFGHANPSGRLTETWPLSYKDVPYGDDYSKRAQEIYKESIYVGYRYYLSKNKEVRFPFGYGLSYTSYDYSSLKVEDKDNELIVHVDVTNKGDYQGKEVVQIYVSIPDLTTHQPLRELKGFIKVALEARETKTVEIRIDKDDLKYWNTSENRFVLDDGNYLVQVGHNSRDIMLEKEIKIEGEKCTKIAQKPYDLKEFDHLTNEEYEALWNIKINPLPKKKPITLESRMSDMNATLMGKVLYNAIQSVAKKEMKKAKRMPDGEEKDNRLKGAEFLSIILDTNSLITLSMSSSGSLHYNIACGMVHLSNYHFIKGIKCFMKKIKAPTLPINLKEEK